MEIHAALMALVRVGNPTVTIYAHRQLIGEPPQALDVSGPDGASLTTVLDLRRLPEERLRLLDSIGF